MLPYAQLSPPPFFSILMNLWCCWESYSWFSVVLIWGLQVFIVALVIISLVLVTNLCVNLFLPPPHNPNPPQALLLLVMVIMIVSVVLAVSGVFNMLLCMSNFQYC